MGRGQPDNGKTSSSGPLFIHLRLAAGSLQNSAKLEATAAVGKAGPHLVHPLTPIQGTSFYFPIKYVSF